MRGLRQLKAMWRDPNMKELIDSLWREYPGLYNEKYDRNLEKWLLNIFGEDIEFAQAIGQDNFLEGNRSVAVGQGLNTKSFFELVLGSYAKIAKNQDAELWILTDRLLALGNGTDADTRSNALEVFKSGLLKLFNALVVGKYEHENEVPEDGTLQFTVEKWLELYANGKWNSVTPVTITEQALGEVDGVNVDFSATKDYQTGSLIVFVNGLKQVYKSENMDNRQFSLPEAPKNIGFTDVVEIIYTLKY
ncbi:MAG: hypothetical protein Q8S54_02440 [Bacteroidota bacterium]|nr:hypothetical protein [Bacteroidota bacterium]